MTEDGMNKLRKDRKALLFVGSPKGLKSSSHSLGSYLLKKLEAGGMANQTLIVGAALHSEEDRAAMQRAVASADLVVISFPLYVDQLPAPLVEALEHVADHRRAHPSGKPQKIMAIVQCGFPETHQNRPATEIMRQFAKEAGFEWAGALAMGMGGAVGGRPLEKAGGMARNVVKALDLAAASLLAGGNVPQEAAGLMGKPLIPRWMYLLMGNWGMKREAKKRGARKSVFATPYGPTP
jgi:putative NADPH-quinone reductase